MARKTSISEYLDEAFLPSETCSQRTSADGMGTTKAPIIVNFGHESMIVPIQLVARKQYHQPISSTSPHSFSSLAHDIG
jgi:hypothetical protein